MRTTTTLGVIGILMIAGGAQALAQDPAGGEVAPEAEPPVPAPEPTPEPAPAPEPPPAEPKKEEKKHPAIAVVYDKGVKFTSEDGDFQLKLALRTQFRFELVRPTADGAETAAHIFIPRGRLQLEGHIFGKDTRYKLEFAAADKSSFAFTKDLYIEQELGGVWLRVGQWKQPFNRMEIVSDFGSVFNERANTAEFVLGGRDVGIVLHNDYEKSPEGLEWAFGVFNSFAGGVDKPSISTACELDPMMNLDCSSKFGSSAPGDWGPVLVGRVGWNHGGIKGYSEGDLEGGPLRFGVGLSYKVDLADLEDGDLVQHGVGLDAIVKVSGFDLIGGLFLMSFSPGVGGDRELDIGATVQAGYFLTPKQAQVAARFSFVPSDDFDGQDMEIRAAFNWYWKGHAWKWATDAGIVTSTGEDAAGASADPVIQVRSMAQLTF